MIIRITNSKEFYESSNLKLYEEEEIIQIKKDIELKFLEEYYCEDYEIISNEFYEYNYNKLKNYTLEDTSKIYENFENFDNFLELIEHLGFSKELYLEFLKFDLTKEKELEKIETNLLENKFKIKSFEKEFNKLDNEVYNKYEELKKEHLEVLKKFKNLEEENQKIYKELENMKQKINELKKQNKSFFSKVKTSIKNIYNKTKQKTKNIINNIFGLGS